MDCNLKKIANFLKFFLCILEKSLKNNCLQFVLHPINRLIFSVPCSNSNFVLEEKGSLLKICAVSTKIQKNFHDNAPLKEPDKVRFGGRQLN